MIQIAIDGPSGSGKSTLAKGLAAKLGIVHLDTGAMYRALGWKAVKLGISIDDREAIEALMDETDIQVVCRQERQAVLCDGEDVSGQIRTQPIAAAASAVSRFPRVREELVRVQQEIASRQSVVMDGRDIGTVVLPEANYKFFITASVEVRAKRRQGELKAKGIHTGFEELCAEIRQRDHQDTNREHSPLRCADDAITMDTSLMNADEVFNTVSAIVAKAKLSANSAAEESDHG